VPKSEFHRGENGQNVGWSAIFLEESPEARPIARVQMRCGLGGARGLCDFGKEREPRQAVTGRG
jgi:hypothetical protein